jgi:NAD(P)-dependent dehydrogenase (short-subunit alcohol dehydrogenase family)
VTDTRRPAALITGGSRGIGAATARALAHHGYDVALTYNNKRARAEEVAEEVRHAGGRALVLSCDITNPDDIMRLFTEFGRWTTRLDLLVLNASGGLEKDRLAADPDFPMHINRDAQLLVLDGALSLMPSGGTVVFVTSHWAHLYGRVGQIPAYEPIAASKHAGEVALRERMAQLSPAGLRLLIVTGDLVEGTITPRLLERASPGLTEARRQTLGALPTAEEFGQAIAASAVDATLPSGQVVVVGSALDVDSSPRS